MTLADPAAAGEPSRSPLSQPVFRAVWAASITANIGSLVQAVGAAWMMTSLTSSTQMVALVQACASLPIMLFALLAGAVADNLDRRLVMLGAQVFMLVLSVVLTLGAWAGLLNAPLLLAFTFLIACGTAFNGPAWQASVGDMVPRSILPSAVALNSMGFNIARSLGPAVGGIIVAIGGAAAAFATNALSYIGLIGVLARWRPGVPARSLPRESIGAAMGAGVRYVAMSPNIRIVLLRAALFGFPAAALPALLPVAARRLIAGGPLTFGMLLGAFGIGAVVGALQIGRLRATRSTEWIVRLASLLLVVGAATTALSRTLIFTLPILVLAGAGWVLALSTLNVTVQMATPRWVVARALALYQMSVYGGIAIGSWVFGRLADDYGVAPALGIGAVLQTVSALAGLVFPLPETSDLNIDPVDRWVEPDLAVKIESRSGPVVITVEYRIAPDDVPAFLTLMNDHGRIRRKNGARHWTVLRDLAEPDLWIERYHFATWLDYVRHNRRRTFADIETNVSLERLQKPGEPMRVHRMIERQTSPLAIWRGRSVDYGATGR